jgi:hypothetical protein
MNLAMVDVLTVNNGLLIPCIKIHRGIDIASRQQGANFVILSTYSYTAAGVVVTLPPVNVLEKTTVIQGESRDPVYLTVMLPSILLDPAPDAGTSFNCTATVTITGVAGVVEVCSDVASAVITPGTGW